MAVRTGTKRGGAIALAVLLAGFLAHDARGASAPQLCAVARTRVVLALTRARSACRTNALQGRADADCEARAAARFASALTRLDARPGCAGVATAAAYVDEVDRFLDAVDALVAAPLPTPTPGGTPTPGACGAAHCCVGVGLSGAGCAFEAYDGGGLTTAEQSCTGRGGSWQAGRCPDACALPAGCCVRDDGCGSVGVFGATDVANLALFCPLIDATPRAERCPD
jgi:hypothetical protein